MALEGQVFITSNLPYGDREREGRDRGQRHCGHADIRAKEKGYRTRDGGTQRVLREPPPRRDARSARGGYLWLRVRVSRCPRVYVAPGGTVILFRRHICTAVTCNLLFSLRPRVVAEIASRIYTR